MDMKHTPGPWLSDLTSEGRYLTIYYDEALHRNFSVVGFGVDQAEANARLMAAAPDLLEVLIEMERSFGTEFVGGPAVRARAAIAKATKP